MNLRYLWIGSVIVLLYALLMSWNQDSARKKELGEAAFIEQIDVSQETPLQENSSLLVIENEKLVVKVSPVSGKVWEARLKEHTYLNNDDSLGVRVFGFDNLTGFRFYLSSGFVGEGGSFKVVNISPSSVELLSTDVLPI